MTSRVVRAALSVVAVAWGMSLVAAAGGAECAVALRPILLPSQTRGTLSQSDVEPATSSEPAEAGHQPVCRLPAEFEEQTALLLGSHQMLAEAPQVFVEIVRAAHEHLGLLAIVESQADLRYAQRLLALNRLEAPNLRFLQIPHDTMWARDYGPMVLEQDGGRPALLDADYSSRGRPNDDAVPQSVASYLKLPVVKVPCCIDGGNLLTNGRGMAVATTDLVTANLDAGWQEADLVELLKQTYGFSQVVLLEPLGGETTGHVDMFVTFPSPGDVVVASVDPDFDPVNAAILDRNAQRLAEVQTPAGCLAVHRIPMPHSEGTVWRTYTNVVYANGALLVPVYPEVDLAGQAKALQLYTRLLPGWKIVPIDARKLSGLGGSLHCVTMNLGGLEHLPQGEPFKPKAVAPRPLVVNPMVVAKRRSRLRLFSFGRAL